MKNFRVPDMTCSGCIRAITNAVKDADPTAVVAADLDTQLVHIDSALAADVLTAALRDAGFTPEPA